MKKQIGFLLALIAVFSVPSFGQSPGYSGLPIRAGGSGSGGSTDGGPASNVITYTTADVNLFVDPTGNDSNACTATGTSACLTIQGAFNKVPKMLRHRVTVNVAAGNYAGVIISGFTIDPGFQQTTAGILLDGVLGNVTPATGSATGTATSGTAGSGATFGTLVNSGATWTVNDPAIVGRFVTITGGTGSGQVRVVTSNTATTLTVAGLWTAPTGTSTYAIQEPASVITSVTAGVPQPITGTAIAGSALIIADNNSTINISVRNIGTSVSASTAVSVFGAGQVTDLLQIRAVGTSPILLNVSGASSILCTTCALIAPTGQALAANNFASGNLSNTYVAAPFGSSFRNMSLGTLGSVLFLMPGTTNASSISVNVNSRVTVTNIRCDCASGTNSVCLIAGRTGVASTSTIGGSAGISVASQVDITNCAYGAYASAGSWLQFNVNAGVTLGFTGNALIYAAYADMGGFVALPPTTTITGATADLALDNGAFVRPFSALSATYSCLNNMSTNSRICRQ